MTDLFLFVIAVAVAVNNVLTVWLIVHIEDKEEE